MPGPQDRAMRIRAREAEFTGIDFVNVEDPCDQTLLRVYFISDVRALAVPLDAGPGRLTSAHVRIHSDDPNVPEVDVLEDPTLVDDAELARSYLRVVVREPGRFGNYRLRIDDPQAGPDPDAPPYSRIDRFFNDLSFSFKAGCDDALDCRQPPPVCPPESEVDFPVDYLARDFVSFRNALIDFAAQRYPHWTSPREADQGMMLAEIFAAVGDELSYVQDRNAREAYLETATQRRSLRKKGRLLDFEIHDGRAAGTLLDLVVEAPLGAQPSRIPAGSQVWAVSEGGPPIAFEIGVGLRDPFAEARRTGDVDAGYAVRVGWNTGVNVPYWFDGSTQCLPVGATSLYVLGEVEDIDELFGAAGASAPRYLLLRTDAPDPAVPARRHFVRLVRAATVVDPLERSQPITRIEWHPDDAIPFQLDQQHLSLSLNVLPATAGETLRAKFVCGPESAPPELGELEPAVEREGPLTPPSRRVDAVRRTLDPLDPLVLLADRATRGTVFLFGLAGTQRQGLAFAGTSLRRTVPEVRVWSLDGDEWDWSRTLLGADATDQVFTLEDGLWQRIIQFRNGNDVLIHRDYATGSGYSLRFGDGTFGRTPPRGSGFEVHYRTGPGVRANVAADSITSLLAPPSVSADPARAMPSWVRTATNPLPVESGVDIEPASEVRDLMPDAFRAETFFAVRAEDYAAQSQRLEFVQNARGSSRWTGSWHTMFVTADPFDSFTLGPEQRERLEDWMECVRQTGREVVVRDPETVPLDLLLVLCVEPFALQGEVARLVRQVLVGAGDGRGTPAFFDPNRFTFGSPLRRSALEAQLLEVPGVRAVREIWLRQRGAQRFARFERLTLPMASHRVLRLDDDPAHPENGTLTLRFEGGA